jgi:hypothetical protein
MTKTAPGLTSVFSATGFAQNNTGAYGVSSRAALRAAKTAGVTTSPADASGGSAASGLERLLRSLDAGAGVDAGDREALGRLAEQVGRSDRGQKMLAKLTRAVHTEKTADK